MSVKTCLQTVAQLEVERPDPHLSVAPFAGGISLPIALLEKYEVLRGEGLAGSGFVIRHRNSLYGVCSIHRFEGNTPGSLEPTEGPALQLDKTGAIRQKDVEAIPLRLPRQGMQSLTYNAKFVLRPGEEVFVLGPSGGVEPGALVSKGMAEGGYKSAQGSEQLTSRIAKPFTAAGGSGCPVIQKSTGAVVRVLLSADDSESARVIKFETLCLSW